ncbi:MAG: valine--tRNA ligase [Bacteroidales bacterium]|nr:valine--tRNA ligase [Bacteroidales bacterium]
MQLASKYDPSLVEDKWYAFWMEKGYFYSYPDKRVPYTIVIPPPNVTGVLHMGHMLNNTLQDVLIRRARMLGFNACWVPGTDHASIATEAKVVQKLQAEGIEKHQLTREEFLKHAWEWKEKHGGIILEQLKKLGASLDWNRTRFTMDPKYYESVIHVFVRLYEEGLIYKGYRMINWDPQALTALSDEEVIYKEVSGKLYYVRYYFVEDPTRYLVIATTRPETILADTAVCVNPNDERYKSYIGKKVYVPLVRRPVSVIADEYVDMEFGTGCLKITPAHDPNDYEIGLKHQLEVIDIFTERATLNEKAQILVGKDRFEARKEIVHLLDNQQHIEKIEDYIHKVGFSERTDVIIEPRLSEQWFLSMKELAKPALDVVMKDEVKFYPAKFKNTYRHWMENVKDWCISRQLWWGHRIPAWYLPDGSYVVAHHEGEALQKAREKNPNIDLSDLKQDEDVLDTWFSSWIWPLAVFDGILDSNNEDFKYYYPTNDLVTAPEIMFFWVARMIMAGLHFQQKIPFKNVYYTGIVRDKIGRKMSKSLGNSPEPLDLIARYGADGVRFGVLFCSPAGNDLLFDESLCEQGRNFSNKIWNALRLVKSWHVSHEISSPEYAELAIQWFYHNLQSNKIQIEENFNNFRISDSLHLLYQLIWDDFCSWYLEIVKPSFGNPVDSKTYQQTISYFKELMMLLHPFMPFITEEVWQALRDSEDPESIMISRWLKAENFDKTILDEFEFIKELVSTIRGFRKQNDVPTHEKIAAQFAPREMKETILKYAPIVKKLTNLESLIEVNEKPKDHLLYMVRTESFFFPTKSLNIEEEKNRLLEELAYYEGFLASVQKKLSNESFLSKAPAEIVQKEKKKEADALEKIKAIKEKLKIL